MQELSYMECFICNRKSLRGVGNYIRKKRLLMIVYYLLFLGEGLIKFDAVFIATWVTLYTFIDVVLLPVSLVG